MYKFEHIFGWISATIPFLSPFLPSNVLSRACPLLRISPFLIRLCSSIQEIGSNEAIWQHQVGCDIQYTARQLFWDQPIVNLQDVSSKIALHNDIGNSAGLFTPNVRSNGLLFVVVSSFAGLSRSHSTSFDLLSSSADWLGFGELRVDLTLRSIGSSCSTARPPGLGLTRRRSPPLGESWDAAGVIRPGGGYIRLRLE